MTSTATLRTRSRRPTAGRLLLDQVRYTLQELWRSRIVFIFTFLFPLIWLVLLYGVLVGNDTVDRSGVRMMQFATPTVVAMGVLFAVFPTVAITLAGAREQGVLKRVRGTPLPAWIYLAGRIGGAVVFAVGSVLTTLAVGVLVYDVQILPRTVLATTVTLVVGIACFAALGVAVAMLAPSAGTAQAASIGAVVVLSQLSGMYAVPGMPAWVDRFAAAFPLEPMADALRDQFNPFAAGSGWDLGALAIMTAWGLAAVVVAARAFRWDPARAGAAARPPAGASTANGASRHATPDAAVRASVSGRPTAAALLVDQVRWATQAAWRDPGWVFFAVAFPVALYALNMAVGARDAMGADGVPLRLSLATGMIAWGAAVTAFINVPQALARARERGVLKRLRGTPLTPGLLLAGRTVSALLIVVGTGALVLAVGIAAFDLRISWAGLPLATAILCLGTLTLAACGFALVAVLPDSKAMGAVGLGILLPVAFFSDVFLSGVPAWMSTVGSFLPLKHLVNSLTAALDPSGPSVYWIAIAVMVAWLVGAGLLAVRTFRWDTGADRG